MLAKIITIAIATTLLCGCLPESPAEAKDKAEAASQKSKEVLTSLGTAAQEGVASGEKALTTVGQTAESTTQALKEKLTTFGERVESLKAAPKAPQPSTGPVVYENPESD